MAAVRLLVLVGSITVSATSAAGSAVLLERLPADSAVLIVV